MHHFGIVKPFRNCEFLETASAKKLISNMKLAIHQGGIIALTGMVGSGKTTLLRVLRENLASEKQVVISRSPYVSG